MTDELKDCKLCSHKPAYRDPYYHCPNTGCAMCGTLLKVDEWNTLMSHATPQLQPIEADKKIIFALVQLAKEIRAEIQSRPDHANIGKKGCLSRIENIISNFGSALRPGDKGTTPSGDVNGGYIE